jgi:regulator of replication initiation timing
MQNRDAKILYKMESESLLIIVSSLVGALGIKEIWQIIKQKIDINAKKEERVDNVFAEQIDTLTKKIGELENKIDELITENTHLKVKIVKMEARLIATAKKRNETKRYKDERD